MIDDGLWHRCRDFVTEQSQGEWSDKDIADDADKLMVFVVSEIHRSRSIQAETVPASDIPSEKA